MLEEHVSIVCKKSDEALIQSIMEESKNIFLKTLKEECSKKYSNFDTKLTIDPKNRLPETMYTFLFNYIRIGGFIMTSMKNRIKIDNTLDRRIELLKQTAIPQIRKMLFDH